MSEPLVQVVDENDQPLGGATKQELWERGLYHRIVGILITDENGRFLSQKRAKTKQPYPEHWDISVGGHVDEGEDYEEAARRELREELGIDTPIKLTEVGYYPTNRTVDGRIMNRFNKRFVATMSSTTPITLDPAEADEFRWFTRDDAEAFLRDSDAQLTYSLRMALEKYF